MGVLGSIIDESVDTTIMILQYFYFYYGGLLKTNSEIKIYLSVYVSTYELNKIILNYNKLYYNFPMYWYYNIH